MVVLRHSRMIPGFGLALRKPRDVFSLLVKSLGRGLVFQQKVALYY